ncbi:8124_t:CDS:2, partial [Ambispora gerdemannii]
MDDLSFSSTSIIKSKAKSIVWQPLLPNIQCIQVSLTEMLSVLDLYMFDITLLGGDNLSKGYEILPKNCIYKGRVRQGDVKAITLVDKNAKQCFRLKNAYMEYLGCSTWNDCRKDRCNWKDCIVVLQDKLLNLCNIEYHEFMNNAKILSITSNTKLHYPSILEFEK